MSSNMKFKSYIAGLFTDTREKCKFESACSSVFACDPNAEIRILINGKTYFLHKSDME